MVFSVEGVVLESFPFKMANSYEFAAVGGGGMRAGYSCSMLCLHDHSLSNPFFLRRLKVRNGPRH